jgi:nucleotide-binding universal stress UspA family protein
MYRRILVPLDGSSLAEHVLPYARLLAGALKTPVHLLACLAQTAIARGETVEMLRLAQGYLDQAAASLEGGGLQVSVSVVEGEPAAEIASEADRQAGTLLVMSTHGRSGLQRMALGSVADRVLRATASPMLVVRPQSEEAPSEVRLEVAVVPLDESELAEQALPHAERLAGALDLKLLVVEALPSEMEYYMQAEAFAGAARDIAEAAEGASEEYLEGVAARLHKAGLHSVEWRVIHGTAGRSIVNAVQELPDSMVIMTTHGRSGMGRWILGSVADQVIRHSARPVLVVRAAWARG